MKHKRYAVVRIQKIYRFNRIEVHFRNIYKEFADKIEAWHYLYDEDSEIRQLNSFNKKLEPDSCNNIVTYLGKGQWRYTSFSKEDHTMLNKNYVEEMTKNGC